MGVRIVFGRSKGGRRYNEGSIDVSHMSESGQQELLSLLRSGRDLEGNPRRVDGMKLGDDGVLRHESYTPFVDESARLV